MTSDERVKDFTAFGEHPYGGMIVPEMFNDVGDDGSGTPGLQRAMFNRMTWWLHSGNMDSGLNVAGYDITGVNLLYLKDTSGNIANITGSQINCTVGLTGVRGNFTNSITGVRGNFTNSLTGVRGNFTTDITGAQIRSTVGLTGVRGNFTNSLTGVRGNFTTDISGTQINSTVGLTGVRGNFTNSITGARANFTTDITGNKGLFTTLSVSTSPSNGDDVVNKTYNDNLVSKYIAPIFLKEINNMTVDATGFKISYGVQKNDLSFRFICPETRSDWMISFQYICNKSISSYSSGRVYLGTGTPDLPGYNADSYNVTNLINGTEIKMYGDIVGDSFDMLLASSGGLSITKGDTVNGFFSGAAAANASYPTWIIGVYLTY